MGIKMELNETGRTLSAKLGLTNTDITAKRKEYVFKLPIPKSFVESFMRDKRDVPMIYLMINIMVTVWPAALFVYFTTYTGWKYHAIAITYIALTMFMYMQRFILCMHYAAHRMVFSRWGDILNNINTHLIAPFFGIPSGMYFMHHCVMHHTAGNVSPMDLSSTMSYQRDNIFHFLHYWAKFLLVTWFYIPYYAIKNGQKTIAINGVLSLACYASFLAALMKHNFAGTVYIFVVPFIVASLGLMFGNWSQHIFVDRLQPDTGYGCTINCVNHFENQLTFNDGYHIVHHLVSKLHWSEMPYHFMNNLDKYAEEDAICFINLGFFEVGLFVMTQQWGKLADAVIQWDKIGGKKRNKEETIAMLKERVKPFHNFVGTGKKSTLYYKQLKTKKEHTK